MKCCTPYCSTSQLFKYYTVFRRFQISCKNSNGMFLPRWIRLYEDDKHSIFGCFFLVKSGSCHLLKYSKYFEYLMMLKNQLLFNPCVHNNLVGTFQWVGFYFICHKLFLCIYEQIPPKLNSTLLQCTIQRNRKSYLTKCLFASKMLGNVARVIWIVNSTLVEVLCPLFLYLFSKISTRKWWHAIEPLQGFIYCFLFRKRNVDELILKPVFGLFWANFALMTSHLKYFWGVLTLGEVFHKHINGLIRIILANRINQIC